MFGLFAHLLFLKETLEKLYGPGTGIWEVVTFPKLGLAGGGNFGKVIAIRERGYGR